MHRVIVWAPDGSERTFNVADHAILASVLLDAADLFGCRPGDLDCHADDGIRMIGEASAARLKIDVCGLPPADEN